MRQRRVCLSGSLGRSKTANISRHETRDLDGACDDDCDAQVDCALRKRRERGKRYGGTGRV